MIYRSSLSFLWKRTSRSLTWKFDTKSSSNDDACPLASGIICASALNLFSSCFLNIRISVVEEFLNSRSENSSGYVERNVEQWRPWSIDVAGHYQISSFDGVVEFLHLIRQERLFFVECIVQFLRERSEAEWGKSTSVDSYLEKLMLSVVDQLPIESVCLIDIVLCLVVLRLGEGTRARMACEWLLSIVIVLLATSRRSGRLSSANASIRSNAVEYFPPCSATWPLDAILRTRPWNPLRMTFVVSLLPASFNGTYSWPFRPWSSVAHGVQTREVDNVLVQS